jgi:uncharacterized phage protein (TIGR01671 family)
MDRVILFRGKRIDNGKWAYGYYYSNDIGNHFIIETRGDDGSVCFIHNEVDENTVCQYTGRSDKNEKKIFENDIVRQAADVDNDGAILYFHYKIIWDEKYARFKGVNLNSNEEFLFEDLEDIEVIGNIFNNPELLREEAGEKIKIKLKPCPFCGSTDLDFGSYTGTVEAMDYVCCLDCGAEVTMHNNNKISLDVLNRWNARSDDNTLSEYELTEDV